MRGALLRQLAEGGGGAAKQARQAARPRPWPWYARAVVSFLVEGYDGAHSRSRRATSSPDGGLCGESAG